MSRRYIYVLPLLIVLSFLSVSAAIAASEGTPVLITFQGDEVGKPPRDWRARTGDAAQVYSVQLEGTKRYIRAAADNACVQLGYEKPWPLAEYPVLQWRWRAVLFPQNSDERKKEGADSVLGLYVGFGHLPFVKFIKYVWSDTVPEGETFSSPFSSRTRIIVVRSGRAEAGTWVMEKRDVLADYQRLFNEKRPPVARGIGILTDSDSTHSRSAGDYGDIRALER